MNAPTYLDFKLADSSGAQRRVEVGCDGVRAPSLPTNDDRWVIRMHRLVTGDCAFGSSRYVSHAQCPWLMHSTPLDRVLGDDVQNRMFASAQCTLRVTA
eukprot:2054017-Pleurochrysis_carterae.AAC.2